VRVLFINSSICPAQYRKQQCTMHIFAICFYMFPLKCSVCFLLLFGAVKTQCRAAEICIDAKGVNITIKAAFEIKRSLPAAIIKILRVLLCAYKTVLSIKSVLIFQLVLWLYIRNVIIFQINVYYIFIWLWIVYLLFRKIFTQQFRISPIIILLWLSIHNTWITFTIIFTSALWFLS